MKSMIAHLIDEEILNSNYWLETDEQFIKRVCDHIYSEIGHLQKIAPTEINQEVADELEDQVIEVFKIKTYGYLNLQHYRKVHRAKITRIG